MPKLKTSVAKYIKAPRKRDQPTETGRHAARQQAAGHSSRRGTPSPGFVPFNPPDALVLVGEGDFGFAAAVLNLNLAHGILATSLDARRDAVAKYAAAAGNIENLELYPETAKVFFEVDARRLDQPKQFARALAQLRPDVGGSVVFMFNFPHIGNSMPDVERNVRQHQELLLDFFAQVRGAVPRARVAVTLFEGEPYASWNIRGLARARGYFLQRSGRFRWDDYPGYQHRLTAKDGTTSKPQEERQARTYLFLPSDLAQSG